MEPKDSSKIQSNSILSDGYGLYPRIVARDKDLTVEAKAIYAYLVSFAGTGGTCFPSRDLILAELGTSKDRFYKHIKLLKEKGYIKVHKNRKGKDFSNNVYEIILDKRDIQCPCFKDMQNKDMQNKDMQNKDMQNKDMQNKDMQNKDTNNNSLNINSINNNSSINSMYVDKEIDQVVKEFSNLYQQNIGVVNGIVAEWIIELSSKLEVGLFRRAVEICTEKGNLNQGYLKGIIKKWLDANITTLEKLRAYEIENSKKKSNNSISKESKFIPKYSKKVHTRAHEINQRDGYTNEELEQMIFEKNRNKFDI